MLDDLAPVDVSVVSDIITALNKLDPDARARVLRSVSTLFGVEIGQSRSDTNSIRVPQTTIDSQRISFSEDRSLPQKNLSGRKSPLPR